MNKKQLLREWYPVDYKPALLKEDREKNGGKLMLQGIIQKANTKNQNKRIYPLDILQREIGIAIRYRPPLPGDQKMRPPQT